jgi:hypothetical protein
MLIKVLESEGHKKAGIHESQVGFGMCLQQQMDQCAVQAMLVYNVKSRHDVEVGELHRSMTVPTQQCGSKKSCIVGEELIISVSISLSAKLTHSRQSDISHCHR